MPDESDSVVPYAPDFTPATLGKSLGEDKVLPWLLEQVTDLGSKAELSASIQTTCLAHIQKARDRADMASHVVQGLRNYGLVEETDDGLVLTDAGRQILNADPEQVDVVFARHILTSCNGQLLVEAIQRAAYRSHQPRLEDLARELDRAATSKNLSTMKAWLQRAGVLAPGRSYKVDALALDRVLGGDVAGLLGLSEAEAEFVIALRILQKQRGSDWVSVAAAMKLAQHRNPELLFPAKARSGFAKALETQGVLEWRPGSGRGGARSEARLVLEAASLSDDQLRSLLQQSRSGIALQELRPLATVLEDIGSQNTDVAGRAGELLAIHLGLALGLRFVGWRKRAPAAEIDVLLERVVSFGYQRWAVQVKNVGAKVGVRTIDREVGAAAGAGITHILFVAPRSELSPPALREIAVRSRLTSLHILYLDRSTFTAGLDVTRVIEALEHQAHELAAGKALEARNRAQLLE